MQKVSNRWDFFKDGFYRGLGWSAGVTLGFFIISGILVYLLKIAGGIPLIGQFVADIVEATQYSLLRRNLF